MSNGWRESQGRHRGSQDYGSLLLTTMRYSLRRALSLDHVDGGTHNPKVGGSDLRMVVEETKAQAGWDRPGIFPEVPDLVVLSGDSQTPLGLNHFDETTASKWDIIET
jgi:hypothetical protein